MNKISDLLEQLDNWRNKTGKFLNSLPIEKLESHRYLPTYYKTEAWLLNQLALAWELENEDGTFPIEPVKKEFLKAEKI